MALNLSLLWFYGVRVALQNSWWYLCWGSAFASLILTVRKNPHSPPDILALPLQGPSRCAPLASGGAVSTLPKWGNQCHQQQGLSWRTPRVPEKACHFLCTHNSPWETWDIWSLPLNPSRSPPTLLRGWSWVVTWSWKIRTRRMDLAKFSFTRNKPIFKLRALPLLVQVLTHKEE